MRALESLGHDLKFAARSLRKSPGFTAAAVLTLGLAIGANTALFSAVQTVLLQPLPVSGLDELVVLEADMPEVGFESAGLRAPEVYDLMDRRDLFSAVGGYLYRPLSLNLAGEESVHRVATLPTIGRFFEVFRVRPHLGRLYGPADATDGNARVAVLSHDFWRSYAGEDPAIIGRTIQLANESYEVVGVLPPGFEYPRGVDVWTPHLAERAAILLDREQGRCCRLVRTVARLQPGVTPARLRAELATAVSAWAQQFPDFYNALGEEVVRATPLRNRFAGPFRPVLLLLLGATGLVLLIAVANVASLQLVRTIGRNKEIAVRVALGADRRAVARYAATESMLVAIAGGVLGVVVGWLVTLLVGRSDPAQIAITGGLQINPGVLLFSAAATIAAMLIFAILPALKAAGVQPSDAMKSVTRGSSAGAERTRSLQGAVIVQIALAFTLLLGTGVALRSLTRLLAIDPGFRPDGAIAMNVNLTIPDPDVSVESARTRGIALYEGLLERLSAIPEVEAAASVSGGPFGFTGDLGQRAVTLVVGRSNSEQTRPIAFYTAVSPNYFRTLGIPLLEGRGFAPSDDAQAPPVTIIDQRLAQELFPDGDAIGQELQGRGRIIGIVGSVKLTDLTEPAEPALYGPFRQFPVYEETVVVRTSLPASAVAEFARATVAELDPDAAVFDVAPLATVINRTLAHRYLALAVLGSIGALALVLAVLGIHWVLSYSVAARAREIGVRLALGSTPLNATRDVVLRAAVLAGMGLLAGALIFAALGRFVSALVFEISANDPLTILTTALILSAVALSASLVPALRASHTDPALVLRQE